MLRVPTASQSSLPVTAYKPTPTRARVASPIRDTTARPTAGSTIRDGFAVLGVAMILVTTDTVSVPVGFFGAAVAVLALQVLTLKEAYDAIEWPVLILLGALCLAGCTSLPAIVPDQINRLLSTSLFIPAVARSST